MLDRANVRYVLTEKAVDSRVGHPLLLDGSTRVLRNDSALPRAYVARAWRAVHSNAEAAAYMQGPGADDSRVPTIEGAPADGAGPHELVPVPIQSSVPERVVIDLSEAPAGWLVLTDSADPGWSATLDGRPAQIHYANGYQRSVEVAAGSHQLVLTYRTPGLLAGAIASAAGLSIAMLWFLVPAIWRRRRA